MKLYTVKAAHCWGEDGKQREVSQATILASMGLHKSLMSGLVVCTAEQAIELLLQGFCEKYSNETSIEVVYEGEESTNITDLVNAAITASITACENSYNTKTNCPPTDRHLLSITETKLLENACTDLLQENLTEGWRILTVCPQPQRRPDYVLGRAYLPEKASRG
jgi:acylphosphatase